MPKKNATGRLPPAVGARVECLHHPHWYAGTVERLTTPFEKGKQVVKMHILFDDETKNVWDLVPSDTWRYEDAALAPTQKPGRVAASKSVATKQKPVSKAKSKAKTKAKAGMQRKSVSKRRAKPKPAPKPKPRTKAKPKPKAKPKARAKKHKRQFGEASDRRLHPPTPEELAAQRAQVSGVPPDVKHAEQVQTCLNF